jgi:hypothetical protein
VALTGVNEEAVKSLTLLTVGGQSSRLRNSARDFFQGRGGGRGKAKKNASKARQGISRVDPEGPPAQIDLSDGMGELGAVNGFVKDPGSGVC